MKNPSDANKPPQGARSDDSSLFSLEALRVQEAAAQTRSTKEDSGLIDLRALAALETADEHDKKHDLGVAAVVAPADIFGGGGFGTPLMAPPPAAAMAAPPLGYEAPAAPKSRGLIIGVAGVAVVGIIAAVFMLTRSTTPVAATTPSAVAPAATSAAPTAEQAAPEPSVAVVTPGQRAAPTATATAAAPSAAPVAKAPAVKGPMPKAAPPKETAPPPPPKEACDLTCQMQRAVQKK